MESSSAAAKNRGRLAMALALTATYMVAEIIGGIVTGSLALIADAAHMGTDVAGLALALFAIWFASRPASRTRTYGYYRAEILAAMANAVILFAISGYILYEAWRRFQDPPEVESGAMLIVASIGLVVNLISAWLLRSASNESLNMRGAYFEVISDLLGSIGVIVAAVIIFFTGWVYADPLFSVGIGLFIIPRTWNLLKEATGVLLEGTPSHVNVADIEQALRALPGVTDTHDLHVWSLTSGVDAMSGHIVVAGNDDVLQQATALLREKFQLAHTTLQIERADERNAEPRGY